MFTIAAEPRFTHEVKARVPVDGGYKEESFKATFRVVNPDKVEAMDLSSPDGTTDFLRAIVVKLDDVADAEGTSIDYSDEVLEAVLRLPYARRALARTYFEAVSGAREGN